VLENCKERAVEMYNRSQVHPVASQQSRVHRFLFIFNLIVWLAGILLKSLDGFFGGHISVFDGFCGAVESLFAPGSEFLGG